MGLARAMTGHPRATLRTSREIRQVLRHGRTASGRSLTAHVLDADDRTRVGFGCSRAVGRAVVRNRARRLMREAWRALAPRTAGYRWIMLVARPGIVGATGRDVMGDLEQVLVDVGAIE